MLSILGVTLTLKIILSGFISGIISHFGAKFPSSSVNQASSFPPALPLMLRLTSVHLVAHRPSRPLSCLLSLRAFSWWSAGPDPGPLEVQLPREPPDGRVRGQAESHPSRGAVSPPSAAHGPGAGMQPEFPHRHRQVL